MRQRQLSLRAPQPLLDLPGVEPQGERPRVRVADVLGGDAHEAPREVEGVASAVEHPREPVQRTVRARPADRLVQGGDLVVERIAPLVEAPPRAAFEHPQHRFFGQDAGAVRAVRGEVRGDLQQVQRAPGVAVGGLGQQPAQRRGHLDPHRAQPAFGVRERPIDHGFDRAGVQRLQDVDPRPGQQGVVELERGVLRRRPHEDDRPVLHVRQEGVLLALVEAVHLVDEQHAVFPLLRPAALRLGDDLADLLHPGQHRREREEAGVRVRGDEPSQGRLAGAGRPPEDHRVGAARLDGDAQRPAGAEEVRLPHQLVEGAGPHAVGEGPRHPGGRLEECFLPGHDHPAPRGEP